MSRFSEVGSVPPGGRKLLKFLILFENPNLLFFPGQFLSGRVLVELEDETPVLGESLLLEPRPRQAKTTSRHKKKFIWTGNERKETKCQGKYQNKGNEKRNVKGSPLKVVEG